MRRCEFKLTKRGVVGYVKVSFAKLSLSTDVCETRFHRHSKCVKTDITMISLFGLLTKYLVVNLLEYSVGKIAANKEATNT